MNTNSKEELLNIKQSVLSKITKKRLMSLCGKLGISKKGTKLKLKENLLSQTHLYCENSQDPVTLQDIQEIEDPVVFIQNGKAYCFSKTSIAYMKSKNITKNPFCIDQSDYTDEKWDITNIEELKDIHKRNVNNTDIPEEVNIRFDIENSTDMYITKFIDFVEKISKVSCKKLLICVLTNVQIHLQMIENSYTHDEMFNKLFIYLYKTSQKNLQMLKHIVFHLSDILKSLFFMEMENILDGI